MTYDERKRIIKGYFGYDQRTINAWAKKGVNFEKLYDKHHKDDRYGPLKKVFYEMFRKAKAEEFYIDRLWERFIQHQHHIDTQQQEVRQYNKKLVNLAREVKQGRKI